MQAEGRAPLSAREDGHSRLPEHDPDRLRLDPRRRRSLFLTLWVTATLTLAADQITKAWALAALVPGHPVPLLGDLVRLTLIRNSGAAFSLGAGSTLVMTIVATTVFVAILVLSRRLGSRAWAYVLGALLGGSLGNLVDRIVREPGPGRGHVVDFIDYGVFIGNVADIAIVGAAVAVAVLSFRGVGVDGRPTDPDRRAPDA